MILIAGATGMLGGRVARQLLAQGRPVRILVRPHSDYAALRDAGAEIVLGDLKDPASLERALQGVDVVLTTANSAMRGGDDNPRTVEHEGNRHLIDAARRAGVRQFVFVSALGASADHPSEFMRGKARAEQYLRESGLPYTILAPNLFMEIWVGGVVGVPLQQGAPVTIIGEGRRKHSFVSVDDVAAFAVAALDNPAAIGRYLAIGGPEPLSWTEVVETTGRVLGREIPLHHLPPGEPLPGAPEVVSLLLAAQDTFDSPVPMDEATHEFGVELTPLEVFVRRAFAPESGPAAA